MILSVFLFFYFVLGSFYTTKSFQYLAFQYIDNKVSIACTSPKLHFVYKR